MDIYEKLGLIVMAILMLSFIYYPAPGNLYPIFFNLSLIGLVIGLIYLGINRREKAYISLGVVFLAIDVIARYFDFFFELMPRSLFFMGGGVLLLGGGVLIEKQRKKLIASIN